MRVQIKIDSATPQEVYDYTLAYQRTLGFPAVPTDHPGAEILNGRAAPVVSVGGTAMGWRSPHITPEQAHALLAEVEILAAERKRRTDA